MFRKTRGTASSFALCTVCQSLPRLPFRVPSAPLSPPSPFLPLLPSLPDIRLPLRHLVPVSQNLEKRAGPSAIRRAHLGWIAAGRARRSIETASEIPPLVDSPAKRDNRHFAAPGKRPRLQILLDSGVPLEIMTARVAKILPDLSLRPILLDHPVAEVLVTSGSAVILLGLGPRLRTWPTHRWSASLPERYVWHGKLRISCSSQATHV